MKTMVLDPNALILGTGNTPRDAFTRQKDAIFAISPDELIHINVDIPKIVGTTLGLREARRSLRPHVEKLPNFNLAVYDAVDDYALATLHAHGEFVTATTPPEAIPVMNEEATHRRAVLLADARSLVVRGVLSDAQLAPFTGTTGYTIVASELFELAVMYRNNAAAIAGKSVISEADVEAAIALATNLLAAVGARAQSPAAIAEASKVRSQAFTLFLRAYDVVRQAVGFLRWHEGDADAFAPSFYAGRGGRKANPAVATVENTGIAPAPNGAAAPNGAPAAPAAEQPPRNPNGPGGSPFANE